MFKAQISITLRKSILDPAGKATEHALHSLGYKTVSNTRIGKFVELAIDAKTKQEAERIAKEAAEKVLSNPIMEDAHITILESQ